MAELNIFRTSGKDSEILEKNPDIIHLFIVAMNKCETKNEHEFGDFLINNESSNRFALIAKEFVDSKIISSALRVSVLNLIRHLLEEEKPVKDLLINRFQFLSKREEIVFISVLREFLLTYFGEVITEPVNLIISECKN